MKLGRNMPSGYYHPVLLIANSTIMNRRMRTRMYGGVGAGQVTPPGYPIQPLSLVVNQG